MIKVGVLTASDKGSIGERVDESGQVIKDMIEQIDGEVVVYRMVADERGLISAALIEMADVFAADLILTTGGTGFSPRDITPEATLDVIDRLVPGIPEAIRQQSLLITSRAMLSRATAGIRNKTLIINLPGSPKAVRESMEIILPVLPHAIGILKGEAGECAIILHGE
ncbi:MAG: MogA/MoaB family molybdenum cofactor biosynthesis protein [Vallitaleaceae bacterium]|nr:MogA/MoaB family molybdenum cofactor biosynthesis protein [Vallitaleaceae bacterium]